MVVAHTLVTDLGGAPLTIVLVVLGALLIGSDALIHRRIDDPTAPGRPPTGAVGPGWPRLIALAALLAVLGVAAFGPLDADRNLVGPLLLSVAFGVVALTSPLFGPWWPRVDPLRGLLELVGEPPDPPPLPAWTPWVATAGLLAWATVQLVLLSDVVGVLLLALLYIGGHLLLAARYGAAWLDHAEVLTVTARLLGATRRLADVADTPALRLQVAALLAWSVLEVVLESDAWHDLGSVPALQEGIAPVALVVVTAALWWLQRLVSVRRGLSPALVGVVAGWLSAQYLAVLVLRGQAVAIWLNDPLDTGANLLGLRTAVVDPSPLPPEWLLLLQLLPFLAGHVVALVAARRRAVAQLGPSRASAATFEMRALIGISLVGGAWLQLGGL